MLYLSSFSQKRTRKPYLPYPSICDILSFKNFANNIKINNKSFWRHLRPSPKPEGALLYMSPPPRIRRTHLVSPPPRLRRCVYAPPPEAWGDVYGCPRLSLFQYKSFGYSLLPKWSSSWEWFTLDNIYFSILLNRQDALFPSHNFICQGAFQWFTQTSNILSKQNKKWSYSRLDV